VATVHITSMLRLVGFCCLIAAAPSLVAGALKAGGNDMRRDTRMILDNLDNELQKFESKEQIHSQPHFPLPSSQLPLPHLKPLYQPLLFGKNGSAYNLNAPLYQPRQQPQQLQLMQQFQQLQQPQPQDLEAWRKQQSQPQDLESWRKQWQHAIGISAATASIPTPQTISTPAAIATPAALESAPQTESEASLRAEQWLNSRRFAGSANANLRGRPLGDLASNVASGVPSAPSAPSVPSVPNPVASSPVANSTGVVVAGQGAGTVYGYSMGHTLIALTGAFEVLSICFLSYKYFKPFEDDDEGMEYEQAVLDADGDGIEISEVLWLCCCSCLKSIWWCLCCCDIVVYFGLWFLFHLAVGGFYYLWVTGVIASIIDELVVYVFLAVCGLFLSLFILAWIAMKMRSMFGGAFGGVIQGFKDNFLNPVFAMVDSMDDIVDKLIPDWLEQPDEKKLERRAKRREIKEKERARRGLKPRVGIHGFAYSLGIDL